MRSFLAEGRPEVSLNIQDDIKLTALTTQSIEVQSGYIDGKLACVWGLIPPSILSAKAHLWLYTTDVVKEHTFVFIRESQLAVRRMLRDYPTLVGNVEVGNTKARAWLKWLGASFSEPHDGRIPFVIRRPK